jgi:hypothetical protein
MSGQIAPDRECAPFTLRCPSSLFPNLRGGLSVLIPKTENETLEELASDPPGTANYDP